MKMVHTMYSGLVSSLMGFKSGEMTNYVGIGELEPHLKKFQRFVKAMLDEDFGSGWYRLKLHLLDHMVDDLELFGCLEFWMHRGLNGLECA